LAPPSTKNADPVENEAASERSHGDFALVLGPSTDRGTLAFNQAPGSPLADKRVRQAIDHEAFVEALASGQTLYGPIPELDPGYEDLSALAPYDPEAAKALLAEAGVEDLTLTLTIPSFYSTTIPQILVSDLNEVGITLEVNSVDFPTWLNDVYINKDYDPASCCTPRPATSRTGPIRTTTSRTTTP
jgi:peptide/nickel transport system substrate-binding protein